MICSLKIIHLILVLNWKLTLTIAWSLLNFWIFWIEMDSLITQIYSTEVNWFTTKIDSFVSILLDSWCDDSDFESSDESDEPIEDTQQRGRRCIITLSSSNEEAILDMQRQITKEAKSVRTSKFQVTCLKNFMIIEQDYWLRSQQFCIKLSRLLMSMIVKNYYETDIHAICCYRH